jgi:hypothetical protein
MLPNPVIMRIRSPQNPCLNKLNKNLIYKDICGINNN